MEKRPLREDNKTHTDAKTSPITDPPFVLHAFPQLASRVVLKIRKELPSWTPIKKQK